MKTPHTLVMIPFKGEIPLLIQSLKSILDSYISEFSYAMILWDDGSTDQELNILWNNIPQFITIIKNNYVGYNQTIYNMLNWVKYGSNSDLLLLCNSDIKVHTRTFFSITQAILHNPNIAAVGGKVLNMGTDLIKHTGVRLEGNNIIEPYIGLNKSDSRTNFKERRLWVDSSCVMYNLDILRKENLNFDIDSFGEENLMTKLNLLGYSIMYDPKSEIEHLGESSHNHQQKNWDQYKTKWEPLYSKLQF